MPQLNGGGGDDLGANDEMISFKDEGEQEEKTSENVSAERDLDDVKSSLVNESESSSDSEVRNQHVHTARHSSPRREVWFDSGESFNVCYLPPRQQTERRPQTRPDLESYEKARDYFNEGNSSKHEVIHYILNLW